MQLKLSVRKYFWDLAEPFEMETFVFDMETNVS